MSHKKERKIRILKSKNIWPRILVMIFTDLIILGCIVFLSYLAVMGILNSHILNNNRNCEKIISAVNKNWNGTSTAKENIELEKNIKSIQQSIDSISEILILDSDFNIVTKYSETSGKNESEITDINFENLLSRRKQIRRILDEGDLARSFLEEDIQNDFIIDSPESMEKISKNFFPSLDFISFANSYKNLRWASELIDIESQWVLYRTEIPGIYVCIKNLYLINNFQSYFLGFLITFFVVFFLVTLVFGILRIISYIADNTKHELLYYTDMVTGGKNKDWFVNKAKHRIRNNKRLHAVVQIRLEKYHNYCASYGVKQGENLLESINVLLGKIVDKKEICAHVEKSDFALLLNYDNEEQLKDRINYITQNLSTVRKNQHLTFVSGVAKVNSKYDDMNSVLSAASLALSKIDNSNANIVFFNDAMKEEQVWERRIEDDMQTALDNHEFKLFLQPKYSTKGEKLAAAEALVRWIHPVLGFISPGKFIPIFENNGFILKLDDYMLTAVAELQAKWMAEGKTLVPISVNVSRAHFTCENLAEEICRIVDEYKVPHEYIELELTESAFFDDKAVLLETVKKLKNFGFTVSMDDFGAGYSSLNSLKELPLDVIKLDAEFFRGIDDVNRANLIVADTISLAKKLGMQIVAEGIETREQVDFLANKECDLIQGFYFAKPLPIEEFEEKAFTEGNK